MKKSLIGVQLLPWQLGRQTWLCLSFVRWFFFSLSVFLPFIRTRVALECCGRKESSCRFPPGRWVVVCGGRAAAELRALFFPLCKTTQPTPTRFFFFFLDFSCCSAGSTASTVNERLSFASLSVAHSHSHSLWWPSLWPHSKYSKALHLHFIIVHYLNYFKHKYISHTVRVM